MTLTVTPTLSRLVLGLALLPPAVSQEVHLAPALDGRASEVRLVAAEPGARALLIDRTTVESLTRPDGLPEGRIVAVRDVDARGEARFPLPAEAFAARAPLAVIVAAPTGQPLVAGALTLPGRSSVLTQASSGASQSRRVIVSEFMKDPAAVSDARGEWIEVYNPNLFSVDLEGWTLSDHSGAATVLLNGGAGILAPARGFAVLARNADPLLNGGVIATAVFTGFSLGNGADQIVLHDINGALVDEVLYLDGPTWPDRPGASISLSPRAWFTRHDDVPSAWCEGESAMPAGDLGTPGAFNDTCWD